MRRLYPSCALLAVLCASPVLAVQTAYWRPYAADQYTYGLFHFDTERLAEGEGKCPAGEVVGEARFEAQGKFGGALRLGGNGAVRFVPQEVFPGQRVCVEAWVKLERYPEKEACIVYRPAIADANPQYDPAKDRAQGFQLTVDASGALHLQVTNVFYGYTIRTSSPNGAVPLNEWAHVAGVTGGLGSYRRVYVNGKELAGIAVEWGQSLWGDETEATAITIGNNDQGNAGFVGLIDEVRLHTAILKLWPPEDLAWTEGLQSRPMPSEAPYFLPGHEPALYLPFDGSGEPATSAIPGLKVEAQDTSFPRGIRGRACQAPVKISVPNLVDLRQGSLEFWMQPIGVENFTDFCRGFMAMPPANLYIYNAGVITGSGLPLSLYFYREGKPVFVSDETGTEIHEGRWYHVLLTWKGAEIVLYLNGRQAGKNITSSMATGDATFANQIAFEPSCQVDELYLYPKALTAEEAANCYARYRDPERVRPVKQLAVKINAGYLPSSNLLYCRVEPQIPREQVMRVALTLVDAQGKAYLRTAVPLADELQFKVPDLPDGEYTLRTAAIDPKGKALEGESCSFLRRHFPWEGNTLGLEETVYPPFEPIGVNGREVSVVLRSYRMNAFGLWDHVVSEGRELLASPIKLRLETADGEAELVAAKSSFTQKKSNSVSYTSEVCAPGLVVRTMSDLEVDGCMKVTMDLLPGKEPKEIRSLRVEIPLRAAEVPLMHVVTDGLRSNYAGKTPEGTGVVWEGTKAPRYNTWQNAFVCYVWLGGEERGLAWFAENDRGWLTEKGGSQRPIQELVREGDQVILRVYLCNTPTTVTKPSRLVFGLQASPTKPMPDDWRLKLADIPGGLPVVPWGGLSCSYQTPWHDDWTIVDKIVEARTAGQVDRAWFEAYAKEHDPPPAHGNWPWVSSVTWFANRCATLGPNKPVTCYQEEMAASSIRDEWRVFQDEWRPTTLAADRRCPDESIFRQGREAGASAGVTFGRSYQDFGVYVANEWLKRGVSLYWDNTYPHLSLNTRSTAAYVTDDGAVQPCIIIWNQREYQKRVWNLLQQWRQKREEPLEWVLHMTNTLLLPVHTWGTADLDHELASDKPFTPEWLRTETTGRQIGNYGLSLYAVAGSRNERVNQLPEAQRNRIEWGMRVVHEIQHTGALEHFLTDFGYGTDEVQVHNYWSEAPALTVGNDEVKWIALVKPRTGEVLIVLASWSAEEAETKVRLNAANLKADLAGKQLTDAETGETIAADAQGTASIKLAGPYGVRVLKVG